MKLPDEIASQISCPKIRLLLESMLKMATEQTRADMLAAFFAWHRQRLIKPPEYLVEILEYHKADAMSEADKSQRAVVEAISRCSGRERPEDAGTVFPTDVKMSHEEIFKALHSTKGRKIRVIDTRTGRPYFNLITGELLDFREFLSSMEKGEGREVLFYVEERSGKPGVIGNNPWTQEKNNPGMQTRILKENPSLALRLISEGGIL